MERVKGIELSSQAWERRFCQNRTTGLESTNSCRGVSFEGCFSGMAEAGLKAWRLRPFRPNQLTKSQRLGIHCFDCFRGLSARPDVYQNVAAALAAVTQAAIAACVTAAKFPRPHHSPFHRAACHVLPSRTARIWHVRPRSCASALGPQKERFLWA